MKTIGFIGIGVMGKSIVKNILSAGYNVAVYSRTKSKASELINKGAIWKNTPKELVSSSDLIFTMVGFPSEVEAVYFGEDGIFEGEVENKILVDLTTSTPTLAKKIFKESIKLGAHSLDSPVSGGDLGALNGTLTIMVGGEESIFNEVLPVFEAFGKTFTYHGAAGSGQHAKMANQIMIAGTMLGMTETLVYANKAGLHPDKVIQTLSGGSASNWSLSNYGPRILAEDYSPGFFVKHFIKDLKIALDEAKKIAIDLPGTTLAFQLYKKLADNGFEEDGTQALIKLWWPDGKRPK